MNTGGPLLTPANHYATEYRQRWCHLSFTSGTSCSPFTWLTCWPTSTYGKKLRVLVYWVPFICSCRPALCVWHSLVASHFITRILTTRILFITQEVTFARVTEFVPKKSSTCIWGLSISRISSASIASCGSWLTGQENAPCYVLLLEINAFSKALTLLWQCGRMFFFFFSVQQDISYRQLKAKSETQFR